MEPEPAEDEEAGSEQPAEEEPEGAGDVLSIAGHEVAAGATTLDASGCGLTVEQVREVAAALPKLLCLRELILDGLPVSGTTPKEGDFRYGVKTLDDLGDLASDELREILPDAGFDEDAANQIIMAARAHWFEDEDGAETNAGVDAAAEESDPEPTA